MSDRIASGSKLTAIVGGPLLFLCAKYGSAFPMLPEPASTIGPVATVALSAATTETLLRTADSLAAGPVLVAAFAVVMNRPLTRPEVRGIPVVRHTLPTRDPDPVVVASAGLGTVFYLLVVAVAMGRLTVLP